MFGEHVVVKTVLYVEGAQGCWQQVFPLSEYEVSKTSCCQLTPLTVLQC